MSEYQYYEFRAIDRPLDRKQIDELRVLSTRAEITPTSFTNTYNWGSFKGDPSKLMDRYFDAFVYVANWGIRQLMFRIPRRLLDVDTVEAYCDGEAVSLTVREEHVVIEFSYEDEPDDEWIGGEGWMPALVSIRDELMRGDFRALYLGWLSEFSWSVWDDGATALDDLEPPVPPGLANLSEPLKSLASFLNIDDDLIKVAAKGSTGEPAAAPSRKEMARWVQTLPTAEKDAYLVRLLAEEGDALLRTEISKRYTEATRPRGSGHAHAAELRTVAQLLEARDALVKKRTREEAEEKAQEQARRDQKQAEERAQYLDGLALREPATWSEVEKLIATKRPEDYDQAVRLLVDLRDLADRSGRAEEAAKRTRELRQRHSKKSSLIKRFEEKNLGS